MNQFAVRRLRSHHHTAALVAYATTTFVFNNSASTTKSEEANNHLQSFSPTSSLYYFHPNADLEICYDTRTRTPVYVLERLRRVKHSTNRRNRRPRFVEELRLPVVHRSRNQHYQSSGYDRGHMAPAADFSHEEVNDTFTLTNVCPQVATLNRGFWNRLEQWVRRQAAAAEENEVLFVVTGPLWLPKARTTSHDQWEYQYPALGQAPSLVSVPTHFFKLVVAVVSEEDGKKQRIAKYAAFVVPNQEDLKSQKLESHLVRWSDLEAVVGMQFFPSIVRKDAQWRGAAFADAATDSVWESMSSKPLPLLLTGGRKGKRALAMKGPTVKHFCAGGVCK